MEKYFLKYYANTATVRFTEKYNISGVLIADGRTEMRRLREEYKTKPRPGFPPREITALCQGNDAVIVKLKMLLDDKKIISPHVVFESMTENGDFVFHAFGRRFSGKVRQENGGEAELVLSPSSPLPEKYAKRGARVFLGYESWIWAAALRPYVYAIPGKPVPVPQEFITPPPEEPDTLPLDFSQPGKPGDFPIREWKLTNGNLFSGRFTGIDASGNYILEGTNRQRIAIDLSEIAKDQRTELFCSAACLQTMPVDSLEIRYRATPPKGKPSEFTISTQGLLGRIDDAEEKMKFIFDLSDRSFILTTRQVNGGQETMTTFIGKFGTHEMFGFRGSTTPRWNRDLLPWETLESFAKNSAAQSALSFQDKWPTRSHLLRVAEHSEGYRIDSPIHLNYISINPPTALVALESRLLLHPPVDHHKIPFSIPRMGANQSLNTLRGFFVSSRMLPLRLQWNVSAPNDPKLISSHVGPYSVEATELRINPSFPSDHFTIPAESRAMQEGTAILVH